MEDRGRRALLLNLQSTFLSLKSHHLADTLLANILQFSVEDDFSWTGICGYTQSSTEMAWQGLGKLQRGNSG